MAHLAYSVFMQKYPVVQRPYRIIETVMTSDGPRSRICDGTWATFEDACGMARAKQKVMDEVVK